jgi:hypothetical protein
MKDIVASALEEADGERGEDGSEAQEGDVDGSEFGHVRVAVVGMGSRARQRLDRFAAVTAGWDHGADQIRMGVAPVEAPVSAPLRAHPGSRQPDLDAADLVVATGHVHAAADVDRMRRVVDRAAEEAVVVAVATVDGGACETPATVADALDAAVDAVVPVEADRAAGAPVEAAPSGASEADTVGHVATAVVVALVEPLPVGAHRPVTPHVPVLPLLEGAGRGVAHVGAADADAPGHALATAALERPLSTATGEPPDAVVAHLATGPDLTNSGADAFRDAMLEAVGAGDPAAVRGYVGAAPDWAAGARRRAVVVAFDGE